MPYGHMPDDEGEECGEADADGYVRERIQTNGRCEVGERARRHLRAGQLPRLRPGLRRRWATTTSGTTCPPRTSRRSSGTRSPCSAWARSASASAACAWGSTLAFAWAAYPVHAVRLELELERRDHAGAPGLGPGLRDLGSRARPLRRPRRRGRSSPRCSCSSRSGPPTRRRSKWPRQQLLFLGGFLARHAAGVLGAPARARPAPRRARLLGPDVRLAALAVVAVLDLGLERVPGLPRPPRPPDGAEGRARRRRGARSRSSRARATSFSSPRSPARLLIGFELVLTHWFYLYIPWFFPFVAFALLVPAAVGGGAEPLVEDSGDAASRRRARPQPLKLRGLVLLTLAVGLGFLTASWGRCTCRPSTATRSSTRRSTRSTARRWRPARCPTADFDLEYPPGRCPSSGCRRSARRALPVALRDAHVVLRRGVLVLSVRAAAALDAPPRRLLGRDRGRALPARASGGSRLTALDLAALLTPRRR